MLSVMGKGKTGLGSFSEGQHGVIESNKRDPMIMTYSFPPSLAFYCLVMVSG